METKQPRVVSIERNGLRPVDQPLLPLARFVRNGFESASPAQNIGPNRPGGPPRAGPGPSSTNLFSQ